MRIFLKKNGKKLIILRAKIGKKRQIGKNDEINNSPNKN